MKRYICGPVSNAPAQCKSLRFVPQHLSLLQAGVDGHRAALEKGERNSRDSRLQRGKTGPVADVLSIAMQTYSFL